MFVTLNDDDVDLCYKKTQEFFFSLIATYY